MATHKIKDFFIIAILLVILGFLWVEIYLITKEAGTLKKENEQFSQKITGLREENKKTEEDASYYSIPQNLEKLLRERFNYKKPGEKMMIIIPE